MENGEGIGNEEMLREEHINPYLTDAEMRLEQTGVFDALQYSPLQKGVLRLQFARQIIEQQRDARGEVETNKLLKILDKDMQEAIKIFQGNETKSAEAAAPIIAKMQKHQQRQALSQMGVPEPEIASREALLNAEWARPLGKVDGIADLAKNLANVFLPNSSKSEEEMSQIFKPVVESHLQMMKGSPTSSSPLPFPQPINTAKQVA